MIDNFIFPPRADFDHFRVVIIDQDAGEKIQLQFAQRMVSMMPIQKRPAVLRDNQWALNKSIGRNL